MKTHGKAWPVAAALVVLVLAACGDSGADTSEFDLVSEGVLTVCTDAPYEPFEFEDPDSPSGFDGFDVDVVEQIADDLGLDPEFIITPFDGIWLQPQAGNCDIVASAMTITEDRAANALFSDPYFDADQSLLVRAAESDLTLQDMVGRTIGVQTGTTGEIYATDNAPDGAELRSYDEPAAMFLALESGDIDAILQDLPVNGFRSTRDDKFVVSDTFSTGEQYGISAAQDNEALIDAMNESLADMRDSGDYDDIFARWFGG